MDTTLRPASLLLVISLALGISADALLRAFPPGINAALWLLFLIAAPTLLAHRLDHSLVGGVEVRGGGGHSVRPQSLLEGFSRALPAECHRRARRLCSHGRKDIEPQTQRIERF